jgi:ATP-binding cassette subfamily F protein uup
MRDVGRTMEMNIDSGSTSGKRVAEVKHVSKAWGDKIVVRDFSTRIQRGDRLAVVGPNGAGKTTMVRVLLGEITPDEGEVKLGTQLEIAYVDQSRAELNAETTLWDVLADSGDQIMVRGRPMHVAAYAKSFLFQDKQLRQPVKSLSGGERNRLLLAKSLARPANLMVLDEPTNDLDMDTLDLLEELLSDYDGTLILVSHDRDFVDRLATSTIALDGEGRAVETPGGWTDFMRQNPGFFGQGPLPVLSKAPAAATPAAAAASAVKSVQAAPAMPPKKLVKLTFKDQRRLEELDLLLSRLPVEIAELDAKLGDPGLYARDPKAFDAATSAGDKLRKEFNAAEEEWLVLEAKREGG